MSSVTKASVAVLLITAVASAQLDTPSAGVTTSGGSVFEPGYGLHGHAREQAIANNKLYRAGRSVDRLNAGHKAEEGAAEKRLIALLEKTKMDTEHKIVEDFAHYKILAEKLRLDVVHLDVEIAAKHSKLMLTKKEELQSQTKVNELKTRLDRLNDAHAKLCKDQEISKNERTLATEHHTAEQQRLHTSLATSLGLKAKLQSMEKYLLDPATQQTFSEIRERMTGGAKNYLQVAMSLKGYVPPAADVYENKVKRVTDDMIAKGREIAGVLQEFVTMIDKETVEYQAAIQRSHDHYTTYVKVLDLKDAHLSVQQSNTELDQKTTGAAFGAEQLHLMDLGHQHAVLDADLKLANQHHDALANQITQEASAEDRKQHNLVHERDVEDTLMSMLEGKPVGPTPRPFDVNKAKNEAYQKALEQDKLQHETLAQQEARLAKNAAKIMAAEKARQEAQAARDKAKADEEARKEAAAVAREEQHKVDLENHKKTVEAQRLEITKAQEAAAAASRAKAVADEEAQMAQDKVLREQRNAREAEQRKLDAKERGDREEAAKAAHELAEAKVAAEEAIRQNEVAQKKASDVAANQAHIDAVLLAHTQKMQAAEAAVEATKQNMALEQANKIRAKQDEIAKEAQAARDKLERKIKAAEAKAEAEEAARQAREKQELADKMAARQAEKQAKKDARAVEAAARAAELSRRAAEKELYQANKKAVFGKA